MKKIILFGLLLIGFYTTKAQTNEPIDTPDSTTKKYEFEIVDELPRFDGGDEMARQNFIEKNLHYPDSAIKYGRQGKIKVSFIVEVDSSVSNVTVIKSFDDECAEEAIRVVKLMRWTPGRQKGKAVRTKVIMPINFKIK